MAIFFTFFSGIYLSVLALLHKEKRIKTFFFIFFVALLSSVFSVYFSHDAEAYRSLFDFYSKSPFHRIPNEIYRHEFFFIFTSKVFSFISFFVYFLMYTLLSFSIKFFLIEKVSRNPFLSYLCYFSFFILYLDGTVVRVSLGIAVSYWGVYALSLKKNYQFISIILVSSFLFHYSLIILMLIFFFRSDFSIKIIWFLTFIFLSLYFLGFGVLDFLFWGSGFFDSSFPGVRKLINYLNKSSLSYPYSSFYVLFFCLSIFVYSRYKSVLNKFEIISFNAFFLSFLILVLFYQSQVLQNRLSEIFRYSLIFISPVFYIAILDFVKKKQWALVIYCVFLIFYFIYYNLYKGIISEENFYKLYLFL